MQIACNISGNEKIVKLLLIYKARFEEVDESYFSTLNEFKAGLWIIRINAVLIKI